MVRKNTSSGKCSTTSVLSTRSAVPKTGRTQGFRVGRRALQVSKLRAGGGGRVEIGLGFVREGEGEEEEEEEEERISEQRF